jgi:3-deoxy-7-phosphoheptulonate synthase
MELPTPKEIKEEFPNRFVKEIEMWRDTAAQIIRRKSQRLVAIVGPCSVHETTSALEYAGKLKQLSLEMEERFFLIMRVFIEKPRTRLGWKGMIYDPHLDGTNDIVAGLKKARKLILQIAEIGIPCASELLEPNLVPYFDDLLVWGLVGARTSASQPHRQMASDLPFPVGFKNSCSGELETALSAIHAAKAPHASIAINQNGKASIQHSKGNPLSHLVLRGAENKSNYDPASVAIALEALKEENLPRSLLIDCSHGNSGKDYKRQRLALESTIAQAETNGAIAGFMLESHLHAGNQPLGNELRYGVSITDPCLGWEETEDLLRSMSISSVQK